MSSNKKRFSLGLAVGLSLGLAGGAAYAGNIDDTYTTGGTLTATMMDNIKNAVNDNNTGKGVCVGNPAVTGDTMVRVGSVCVDKYEASFSGTCADVTGATCTGIAKSVTGVSPAVNVTWYQAARLCANAGKRLITNAEWQMAAIGTPTGTPACNGTGSIVNTGATATCVSSFLVNDMGGNAAEWVADWATSSGDNVVNVSTSPVGVTRGGDAGDIGAVGPNYHGTGFAPSTAHALRGFRCAR